MNTDSSGGSEEGAGAVVLREHDASSQVTGKLGGGWELREGEDFVSDATKAQMRERTKWGDLLSPEERAADINAATADMKNDLGQWQWREWAPKW